MLLLQGLGAWASFAHQVTNLPTPEVDSFVKAAIFATLTNVSNFSSPMALLPAISWPVQCQCGLCPLMQNCSICASSFCCSPSAVHWRC